MSFIVLRADRFATALADDPVIPAAELRQLQGAMALFEEADLVRRDAGEQADAARRAAHEAGFAEGRREGAEAGATDVRAELFRLAIRDGEERRARRAEVAALALEVVRRIAGEIGDAALVAGLADRATAALVPDTIATVRVAPAQIDAVSARLANRPGILVEADTALAPTDCVVETALGTTRAGLDTQLAQIEAAWSGAAA
jgi:type III secretion protein L